MVTSLSLCRSLLYSSVVSEWELVEMELGSYCLACLMADVVHLDGGVVRFLVVCATRGRVGGRVPAKTFVMLGRMNSKHLMVGTSNGSM